jgi:hypothetical protein
MLIKPAHLLAAVVAFAVLVGALAMLLLGGHGAASGTRTVVLVDPALSDSASTAPTPSKSEQALNTATAHVRSAIPAIEAYYADHNSYQGVSTAVLKSSYDAGIGEVEIVRASAQTYCVQSTVDGQFAAKDGPGAGIVAAPCGPA